MKKIAALVLAVLIALLCPACGGGNSGYYAEVAAGKYPHLTVYDPDAAIVFNLSYQDLISAWSENGHTCDLELIKKLVIQDGKIDGVWLGLNYYASIDKVQYIKFQFVGHMKKMRM